MDVNQKVFFLNKALIFLIELLSWIWIIKTDAYPNHTPHY
jgi:hypothetical protein